MIAMPITPTVLQQRREALSNAIIAAARAATAEPCPACGKEIDPLSHSQINTIVTEHADGLMVVLKRCPCGAHFGQMSYQESLNYVKNQMEPATGLGLQGDVQYFDFDVFSLDEDGNVVRDRRHGWFNVHSRLVVQIG